MAALIGRHIAGRFRIDDLRAGGPVGPFLRGYDRISRQPVDVIEVPAAVVADAAARREFLREVDPLRAVRHRAIRRVLTVVQIEDGLHLVQQAAHGDTLQVELDACRGTGLSVAALDVVTFARGVCDALLALHESGLWHGALCPHTIAFADDGQVRLTGLGQARLWFGREEARRALAPYTECDRAPTDAVGGARADRFALATILAETLLGESALAAGSRCHSLGELRDDLPSWLVQGIERELDANYSERFQDTAEWKSSLTGTDQSGLAAAI